MQNQQMSDFKEIGGVRHPGSTLLTEPNRAEDLARLCPSSNFTQCQLPRTL